MSHQPRDRSKGAIAIAKKPSTPAAVKKLLKAVLKSLDDDKAEDIVTVDLNGKSSIADYLVIASGRSSRQVSAIADHLSENAEKHTGRPVRVEGKRNGDWVLIDVGDVIVHVFRPEVRATYNLEKMWAVSMPEQASAA